MVLHSKLEETNSSSFEGTREKRALAMLSECGRHQHISPIALVTKNLSQINIRSDQLTYRIMLGLLDGSHYIQQATHHIVEYKQVLPKGRGYVRLALSLGNGEPWELGLDALNIFGDELVDTFLVLLAVALDTHGTKRITFPFTITADDILAVCQKKKSKGSYLTRQRQQILDHVQTLSRLSVCAALVTQDGKDGKLQEVESPLLDIVMHQQTEESKAHLEYRHEHSWSLKVGDWAGMFPKQQSQIVPISRQLLQYHAKQQKYEKRIGRYLTMLYRINTYRHQGYVKVSMGVLLEHAGILLDRDNPGRTREAIERALHQLHSDGIIGQFAPLIKHSSRSREVQERIEQHAYHWWDDYQQQLWLFAPPNHLSSLSQHIFEEAGGSD